MNSKDIFILTICTIAPLACGTDPTKEDYESKSEGATVASVGGSAGIGRRITKIPVNVGYLGTAAEEFSLDVTGCLSSHIMTVTEADFGGVELYNADRFCVAKLTAFTAEGISYDVVSTGAANFTT